MFATPLVIFCVGGGAGDRAVEIRVQDVLEEVRRPRSSGAPLLEILCVCVCGRVTALIVIGISGAVIFVVSLVLIVRIVSDVHSQASKVFVSVVVW